MREGFWTPIPKTARVPAFHGRRESAPRKPRLAPVFRPAGGTEYKIRWAGAGRQARRPLPGTHYYPHVLDFLRKDILL
jgi:alpha-beta hydrolase superfamily lysophospholipase